MRIWSLHPRYLDPKGLVALWREALLAQAVLKGDTRGYRHHPQLVRFREAPLPHERIAAYLHGVHAEAVRRGYQFDATKIGSGVSPGQLPVTQGQLDYEWKHLKGKLAARAPAWLDRLGEVRTPEPHPLFHVIDGDIADWEAIPIAQARSVATANRLRSGQRAATAEVLADVRGASRMLVGAVHGVTRIVEELHRSIAGVSPIIGAGPAGPARGISAVVYRSVHGVTHAVGAGLDRALARMVPLLRDGGSSARREAVLAALNGVLGDYLVASNNPLAIPMQLRQRGRPLSLDAHTLAADIADAGCKLLVLVHGLCMNDLEWTRDGHDHGASLAQELGYTAVYLQYNSGLHVSTNGREFAATLERLVRAWPARIDELVIVGHSMGGLLSRSACHYALQANHAWLRRLTKLVFLGTPHHGAPLERAGNWVHVLVSISPYTAPFARLGQLRSAGIKDLRYGNLVDEDWQGTDSTHRHDTRTPVPLPAGVQSFALAASRQRGSGKPGGRLSGDGLVPVDSALGRHANAARTLPIPATHLAVCHGLNHLDLLGSRDVYERMRRWLEEG